MTKCRKRRYRDKVGALLALATITTNDRTDRPKQEARAYRCPACKGWHLTSQTTTTRPEAQPVTEHIHDSGRGGKRLADWETELLRAWTTEEEN